MGPIGPMRPAAVRAPPRAEMAMALLLLHTQFQGTAHIERQRHMQQRLEKE